MFEIYGLVTVAALSLLLGWGSMLTNMNLWAVRFYALAVGILLAVFAYLWTELYLRRLR